MDSPVLDVIIIGGSYSGLSAALALARSGRHVLVLDSDDACNKNSDAAYNILTNDGVSPAEIKANALSDVATYSRAQFDLDPASRINPGAPFLIETESGATHRSKTILLCTGMADIIPDVRGFAECWGKSIIHCPYCHAYEQQARHIGMYGHSDADIAMAGLLKTWNKEVTLFTDGLPLSGAQREILHRQEIDWITAPLSHLQHRDGWLSSVEFNDGTLITLTVIFINPATVQRTPIAESCGCKLLENGLVQIDDFNRTTVTDIYAAGDCCTPFRTISTAIASGTKTGIFIHQDLHKNHLNTLLEGINRD